MATTYTFEGDATITGPAWLRGPIGGAWRGALGRALDWYLGVAKQAVKARFVATAPVDALAVLGDERRIPRFPGDTDASYRARVAAAWTVWTQAGTAAGILAMLAAAGFTDAAIYTARGSAPPGIVTWPPDGDTANWSRFWVYLDCSTVNPFGWQVVTWGDGHVYGTAWTWGSTATPGEVAMVRGIVRLLKAAHEICPHIYVKLPGGTVLRWIGMV